jgi:cytochrome c biogenesis protein CcmG, thiol:disulfide interchange protein DsbE
VRPVVVLRVIAAAGVVAMAATLGWRVTHQHNGTARAIASGKIVKAPAFRLKRLSGEGTVSLGALRGKAVVLNFWASSCLPCKQEMPRLQRAATRWAARRVAVVGIDVLDSRGAAQAFARKHGVTYAIGYDPLGDTVGPYGVDYTPTTFFVDRRGRIVKRILGPVSTSDLDSQIGRALSS